MELHDDRLSPAHPGGLLILVDQSASMNGQSPQGVRKAELAAEAINALLLELVIRCARAEGVYDVYHIGVFGYGDDVQDLLPSAPAQPALLPVSWIAEHPARIEAREQLDPQGHWLARVPVWVVPSAGGGRARAQALARAWALLTAWRAAHPGAGATTLLEFTDGGEPAPPVRVRRDRG